MRLAEKFNALRADIRGTSAIELAFCMPLVLAMFFGCFKYGLFFFNATEVNRNFDEVSRAVLLLDQPTKSEIEAVIGEKLSAKHRQNLTYAVTISDRYDEKFADISMDYTFSIEMPFMKSFDLKSSYQNFVMLSEFEEGVLSDSQTSGTASE